MLIYRLWLCWNGTAFCLICLSLFVCSYINNESNLLYIAFRRFRYFWYITIANMMNKPSPIDPPIIRLLPHPIISSAESFDFLYIYRQVSYETQSSYLQELGVSTQHSPCRFWSRAQFIHNKSGSWSYFYGYPFIWVTQLKMIPQRIAVTVKAKYHFKIVWEFNSWQQNILNVSQSIKLIIVIYFIHVSQNLSN